MSDMALVQQVVDRILIQDLEPALDLVAEDVELMLVTPELSSDSPAVYRGTEAGRDYIGAQGGIVTFWQVRFVADGDQVLVLGRERYTTNAGLESDSDFVLVCQVREGVIVRIVLVEDLAGAALLPTKQEPSAPSRWSSGPWKAERRRRKFSRA